MQGESKVEALAMRWIEARVERDRLYDLRSSFVCAHESAPLDEPLESGGTIRTDILNGPACWKGHYEQIDSDGNTVWKYERDVELWCASCKARGEAHTLYVKARQITQARLGALNRVCLAEYKRRLAPSRASLGAEGKEQ